MFETKEPSTSAEGDFITINYDDQRLSTRSRGRSISDALSEYTDDSEAQAALRTARKEIAASYFSAEKSLRALRLSAGLSQKQLAEAIDSQQTYISRLEKGRDDIRLSTIKRLAEALNTDVLTIVDSLGA